MGFKSLDSIVKMANEKNQSLFEVILYEDMSERDVSRDKSFGEMLKLWEAMKNSYNNHSPSLKSASGLVGGDSELLKKYGTEGGPEGTAVSGETLCGEFANKVMYTAMAIAESNACMKCIVAAPTAGSCGVMPGVLIPFAERFNVSDEKIAEALYVSAGVGEIIAQRASIAGAQGGCQAEIGSAAAMAAAALAYLMGQSAVMVMNAAALALKNMLGLACDPVAGLVEVPCVKRNSFGAMNAVMAADMSMAGIKSVIPADEVIDAMGEIGSLMPAAIKETSKAGLAATDTGVRILKKQKGF